MENRFLPADYRARLLAVNREVERALTPDGQAQANDPLLVFRNIQNGPAGHDGPTPAAAIHGGHSDARCNCGAWLSRSEMPHPDRDLDVFPYSCPECRKRRYLLDFHAELDQALFDVWVRDPLAMVEGDSDPRTPLTSLASLP